MPRTQDANQQIRELQRAKILDAARHVFALKGWSATMSDVATAAGVSQGLAYRYFANKEALINDLVTETVRSGLTGLQEILDSSGTPGERLAYLVSSVFSNRRERLEYYQLFFLAPDEAIPDNLRNLLQSQIQTFQDVLKQLLIEGQATGEILDGDPEQIMNVVIACFDGLSRLALRDPEHFEKHFPNAAIILRLFK